MEQHTIYGIGTIRITVLLDMPTGGKLR